MQVIEHRFAPPRPERRAPMLDSPARRLRGSILFNVESLPVWSEWGPVFMILRRGVFDAALAGKQDVRALWNSQPKDILGRTAAGTLFLWTDDRGLHYEILLPDSQLARDLAILVNRRDITGSSFGFRPRENGERYSERPDGSILRELTSLDLFDLGPATYSLFDIDPVNNTALTLLALA